MRLLLLLLMLLGIVIVAGAQALEARATGQVADALAASTQEVEGVDVELAGFPVALRAATGRIPEAVIEVDRLITKDPEVTFAPVVMDLADVRFDPIELAFAQRPALTIGDGSVSATLSAEEVSRLAAQGGGGWTIRLQEGQLVATGDVNGSEVRVVVEAVIVDGALQLTASEVAVSEDVPAAAVAEAFDRSITLPELPGRIRLTDVELGQEGIDLAARIRGPLDLGS